MAYYVFGDPVKAGKKKLCTKGRSKCTNMVVNDNNTVQAKEKSVLIDDQIKLQKELRS